VRAFDAEPISEEDRQALQQAIDEANAADGLALQLVCDEPHAFSGRLAHYGSFRQCTNYIALVAPRTDAAREACGYRGEQLVLLAQQLGLRTCWVGLTYRRPPLERVSVPAGMRLHLLIALGHGALPARPRKSKTFAQVARFSEEPPAWFRAGVEAALLAPTALNWQRFRFDYRDGQAHLRVSRGTYAAIHRGILRLHFEIGSGHKLGE